MPGLIRGLISDVLHSVNGQNLNQNQQQQQYYQQQQPATQPGHGYSSGSNYGCPNRQPVCICQQPYAFPGRQRPYCPACDANTQYPMGARPQYTMPWPQGRREERRERLADRHARRAARWSDGRYSPAAYSPAYLAPAQPAMLRPMGPAMGPARRSIGPQELPQESGVWSVPRAASFDGGELGAPPRYEEVNWTARREAEAAPQSEKRNPF